MMNYIWGGMILLSLVISVFTGRVEETSAAAVSGAAEAVETCIALLGIMCLWTGLGKIGERAGIVKALSKLLTPLTQIMFPKIEKDSAALGSIVMNMVANLFGMGNAATPLGLKAMDELSKLNKHSASASDAMCMFVVLNTASIQLIPTTVISLRQTYGSAAPAEILLPVWISSACALFVGIISAKILERRRRI